ncbi:MAG: (2R)-3-sulfolactate dehydrogenase [Gaiellaceae bacterium]|nr:(2R)-3-sulfolactate dehydrogenase [Gaiellaceae bacterium]
MSEAQERIEALGFAPEQAQILAAHFEDAERQGRTGHGLTRIDWLATLPDLDPRARPRRTLQEPAYERWDGAGALGYLVLEAIVTAQLADPPERSRLVVASRCFPTGHLGYWTRRLAEAGLVAVLTATSPPRLPHPDGGEPLIGTIPLSIAIPSSDGPPIVSDVSMAKATYGDVLAGRATADDLVAFGGPQAHKAFALGLGLQLLVEALAGTDGYAATLLVARPEADPVPALRERAGRHRLPGDRGAP